MSTSTAPRKFRLKQPLTDEDFLDRVIKRSRERGQVLGDLCRFEIKGAEVPPNVLFDLLKRHGLQDWHPVPIRKKTAARKAITRIRPLLEDPSNDMRVIVRPVVTNEPDVVRYAIIDEYTDTQTMDLDYTTRNQVVFRTDVNTLEFTQVEVPEIREMFDYLCSVYTDREIVHMVKNIVSNYGTIWLHDNSGMFFMPHSHKELVDKLVALFADLQTPADGQPEPTVCYFRPIGILDDADNRATMGEALIADITVELNEATQALDDAIEKESAKTLSGALNRFKRASGKARLYKDMLELNIDGINTQIDDANKKAGELMVSLTAKKKTKKTGTKETDDETQ